MKKSTQHYIIGFIFGVAGVTIVMFNTSILVGIGMVLAIVGSSIKYEAIKDIEKERKENV